MNPPLISCIVPVFNGERYLKEALESIRAQTYRPLELIVADDGSTDGTAAVAAGYGEQVRYLFQPNAGPAAARNLGLTAARGEFVAFLDHDDLWHPEKLARQMARFQARPGLDLCFTHFQNFWMPDLAEEKKCYQEHPLSKPLSGYCIGTLVTRRAVFEKYGNFNEDLRQGENIIWFLRAAEQGAITEILPDVLMHRRLHLDSQMRRGRSELLDSFFLILKAWRDYQRPRFDKTDRLLSDLPNRLDIDSTPSR